MSEDKIILPLAVVAQRKRLPTARDALVALISHIPIYAHVENVTLTNPVVNMNFAITDLPIPEPYLSIILGRGTWEGNRIEIRVFEAGKYRLDEATFAKEIRLSVEDLFVYEHDLASLESRSPGIFPPEQIPAQDAASVSMTAPAKGKKKYQRGAIPARAAATILGMSERQIRKWDAGTNRPLDYPGRMDEAAFQLFANRWIQTKRLTAQARAMNRPISVGGMIELAAIDDEGDDDET